jgi:hypothetical protein
METEIATREKDGCNDFKNCVHCGKKNWRDLHGIDREKTLKMVNIGHIANP